MDNFLWVSAYLMSEIALKMTNLKQIKERIIRHFVFFNQKGIIKNMEEIKKEKIVELNPLSLASVGDAFHTLFVRESILKARDLPANKLHLEASKICCAKTQAKAIDKIFDVLNEDEKSIALRARNHRSHTVKSSSQIEYKKATAFEAVLGYLFLTGQNERASEIAKISMEENL